MPLLRSQVPESRFFFVERPPPEVVAPPALLLLAVREVDVVRRRVLVGVLAALLLLGCGREAESGGPAAVPKALPGSPPGVEAALLTTGELGDGWVDAGATPFEQRGLDECPATNVLTSNQDQSRVGEAQTYFEQGEGRPALTFFESVSLWESAQVARERLATFATATTCVGVTQRTPDGPATVTFTDRPVPQLGDETVAQSARFDFAGRPDSTVDLIAIRLGNVIVTTSGERYDGSPAISLDTARLEALTRTSVDKVKRSLPLS